MANAPSEAPATFAPEAFGTDSPETLYLLTSLTSGSSSIITATSRLEHLLKSHRIAFKAVDVATDDKARMLWGRRAKGKRLPGVVKDGVVLGNFEDLEDWNEHGELKSALGLKKKKKSKSAAPASSATPKLDGNTSSTTPSLTAKPNVPTPEGPKSSTPTGGVPTAFTAAAAAAAAAGRELRKAGGQGVKIAVDAQGGAGAAKEAAKKEAEGVKKEEVKNEEVKNDEVKKDGVKNDEVKNDEVNDEVKKDEEEEKTDAKREPATEDGEVDKDEEQKISQVAEEVKELHLGEKTPVPPPTEPAVAEKPVPPEQKPVSPPSTPAEAA